MKTIQLVFVVIAVIFFAFAFFGVSIGKNDKNPGWKPEWQWGAFGFLLAALYLF